jgi:autotransporter adhesin
VVDQRFAALDTGVGPGSYGTGPGSYATAGATAIGNNAQALGQDSYASGDNAYAAGEGDMAIGANARVNADYGTAVGTNASIAASSPRSTAIGANTVIGANAPSSTAIGYGAQVAAGAANSVALGAGSVATEPYTVSVGSAGSERRITNVAAGIDPTDAVNVGQMDAGFAQLQGGVSYATHRANIALSGVAMGMAMGIAPLNLAVGGTGVAGGVATYAGDGAVAFKFEGQPTSHLSVSAGVGYGNDGMVSAAAGMGWAF